MTNKGLLKGIMALFALFILGGCGSVISREVLRGVDRSIKLDNVQSSPDLYKGRQVIWGGIIVSTENLESVTHIEVLETPLQWGDTPSENGSSRGRFIIEAKGFLDTKVYAEGKRITVAGVVQGVVTKKIGKMDYPYPVVAPREMKLYEPPPRVEYYDVPPWWYRHYYPYPWPWPYPPPPGYPYPWPYPYPPYPYP